MGTSNKPTLLVRDGDDKSITAKHLRDLKNLRNQWDNGRLLLINYVK